MAEDYLTLPPDLPVPEDDGAADHLPGRRMPALTLPSTTGEPVALDRLPGERAVIYIYPFTGTPGEPPPDGWNAIPGARGCTVESCAFRDHHRELRELGAEVLGLSIQTVEEQQETSARLRLPYPLLSDPSLELAAALDLPTFTLEGTRFYRRLTLVIRDGAIEHVFYPIFPPDRHAAEVAAWLRSVS